MEPDDATDRIALAVVTKDRAGLVERFLLPSLRYAVAEGHEVLVVDQSRSDETRRLVEDLPDVRYLRSETGLSHGRNLAIESTTAAYLAFTDDDVTFPPGWLDRIRQAFLADGSIGAICGRGTTPGGTLLPGVEPGLYRWPTIPFGLGSGFNMALRRAVFDEVGAFDGSLGAGSRFRAAEDTDMLHRLMRAGWTVGCRDDITVVHHDWRSPSEEFRNHYGYGLGAGAQTAKHLRAGDKTAGVIALKEIARHIRTFARALLLLRPRVAALQVLFVLGMLAGLIRRALQRG